MPLAGVCLMCRYGLIPGLLQWAQKLVSGSRDRLAAPGTPRRREATIVLEAPIAVSPACINKGAWANAKVKKWAWDAIKWIQRTLPHPKSLSTVLRARTRCALHTEYLTPKNLWDQPK